jgi:hypothetical protein
MFPTNLTYRGIPNFISIFRSKKSAKFETLLQISYRASLLHLEVVGHLLNPHAGRPHLVLCPRLLIQYICYCPPQQEVVSFTPNLRAPHAMMTRDLLNMSACLLRNKIHSSCHFLPPFLRLRSDCSQGIKQLEGA